LKYVVSNPGVTVAIPATSQVSHLLSTMRAGMLPEAGDAQRRAIVEAINR
jgi:aryl-alcohol dehydrogenase-like predicted oxidoreductase